MAYFPKFSSIARKFVSLHLQHQLQTWNVIKTTGFCRNCRTLSNLPFNKPTTLSNTHFNDSPYSQIRCINNSVIKESIKDNLYKVGVILPNQYKKKQLKEAAHLLLNGIYMKVPHAQLREVAALEDSFDAWMKIVYIHLWFLICRLKQEGRDGQIIVMVMVKMLWQDVAERLSKLQDEVKQNVKAKKLLREYYSLLYSFFTFLDEGILGSDAMLASSVWQLVYAGTSGEVEAWHLENLVHYIRFTAARMNEVAMDTLVLNINEFEWTFPQALK